MSQNKGKEMEKLLPNIEEISNGKTHTKIQKLIRTILYKFPYVCVCLSIGDLFNIW